jgi:hypothetical protein
MLTRNFTISKERIIIRTNTIAHKHKGIRIKLLSPFIAGKEREKRKSPAVLKT